MARKSGVRVVNGYWYSAAGGNGRYFGRVQDVSQVQAMARLWAALAKGTSNDDPLEPDRVGGG